jgi:hypothetical protein
MCPRFVQELAAGSAPATAASHDRREFQAVFANQAPAIFGAALLWLLFDIVGYSGILFGPSLIAKGLGLAPTSFSLITWFAFVAARAPQRAPLSAPM